MITVIIANGSKVIRICFCFLILQTKMARKEEAIPSTVESKMKEHECAKQELFDRGISEACFSTRRLASIQNKGVVVIEHYEVSRQKN